ncbi:MAG TPA: hypothetical protein PKM25_17090 [Candidatus Ozemobacteraceae bacterium]|mgnify:CR=1 FL=1|nr:hypothetical protein [Candidatus Ozemobacteraceae bacterium]
MLLTAKVPSRSFLVDSVTAGILLALALAIQNLRLPNLITGAVVNAVFVVAVSVGGVRSALLLAGLTPVGAFLTGHLPPPMILLLPVIIPGNIIYVVMCDLLRTRSLTSEAVAASAAKAVLIGAGGFLLSRLMNWPAGTVALLWGIAGIQFFTAIAGVVLGEIVAGRIGRSNGTGRV